MTEVERREYQQAIRDMRQETDTLRRLIAWLEDHGVGSDVAVRSTVAEHEQRITQLENQ